MKQPTWDGDTWSFRISLPAWKLHLAPSARGRVQVIFSPEGDDERKRFPSELQLSTVSYLEREQRVVLANVSQALRKYYDAARPRFERYARELPHLFDDFAAQMPAAPNAKEFAKRHTLQTIYVQPIVAARHAYVGFSFGASWEIEHGVGVLVHRGRVVEVGGADTAFLMWIAERDAKRKAKPAARKAKPKRRPTG
jgi:hypothetical protein